jgi:CRP-like cAMP-binding protein
MLTPARTSNVARTAPLEARLQSYAPLKPSDVEIIRACCDDLKGAPAGSEILSAEAAPEHPRLIVSGWAAAARSLSDGRRQILRIFLPGDVLGQAPMSALGAVALSSTTTTDARPLVAGLASRESAQGNLRLAWERAMARGQQQLLDQIVRLGRLSAYERTAHLLLELMERHRRAGLSDGRRMPWPLTQETLSDVLGLSVVHVNRILQQLRREGVIALRSGLLLIPDADRLAVVANWEG